MEDKRYEAEFLDVKEFCVAMGLTKVHNALRVTQENGYAFVTFLNSNAVREESALNVYLSKRLAAETPLDTEVCKEWLADKAIAVYAHEDGSTRYKLTSQAASSYVDPW